MRKRSISKVFLAVLWYGMLVLSSTATADEPVIQTQLATQEKRIAKLESELNLLQQKYETQQTTFESTTAALRVQDASLRALQNEGIKQTQLLKALENSGPKLTDWLMVIVSFALLLLSFLAWQLNKQIAWFTGAMESHSDLMLRIEALRGIEHGQPIELIWWDPNIEEPPIDRKHGNPVDMKRIYLYLPLKYRRNKPSLMTKLCQLFSSNCSKT